MSLFGCGTVIRPGLVGCLNCRCVPFAATCTQPSCWSMRMSLPLLRSTTYSLVVYQYTHSRGPINPVTTLFCRYGRPRTALVAVTSATPTSKFNPSTLRRGRRPPNRQLACSLLGSRVRKTCPPIPHPETMATKRPFFSRPYSTGPASACNCLPSSFCAALRYFLPRNIHIPLPLRIQADSGMRTT